MCPTSRVEFVRTVRPTVRARQAWPHGSLWSWDGYAGGVARVVLVRPGAGAPDVLALEAWRALTTARAFAAPGDPLAERLLESGYDVTHLTAAGTAETGNG